MKAVLIAGPTASGKSALALDLATRMNGAIVNADSMQVYDTLRVLTARPTTAEIKQIPHHLYGHVPAVEAYSVGRWSRDVEKLLTGHDLGERVPIFVGGTGLYFKALLGGLSNIPQIPQPVRDYWRDQLMRQGSGELHAELERRDPFMAERLKPGDGQRIVRALEVIDATGQSIHGFQQSGSAALIDPDTVRKIVFRPDRVVLQQRIRTRFEGMMRSGAVEEVQSLLLQNLPADASVMKAIGVREITAMIEGRTTEGEAVELAVIASRQYAKRQMTWFRNQFGDDWETV